MILIRLGVSNDNPIRIVSSNITEGPDLPLVNVTWVGSDTALPHRNPLNLRRITDPIIPLGKSQVLSCLVSPDGFITPPARLNERRVLMAPKTGESSPLDLLDFLRKNLNRLGETETQQEVMRRAAGLNQTSLAEIRNEIIYLYTNNGCSAGSLSVLEIFLPLLDPEECRRFASDRLETLEGTSSYSPGAFQTIRFKSAWVLSYFLRFLDDDIGKAQVVGALCMSNFFSQPSNRELKRNAVRRIIECLGRDFLLLLIKIGLFYPFHPETGKVLEKLDRRNPFDIVSEIISFVFSDPELVDVARMEDFVDTMVGLRGRYEKRIQELNNEGKEQVTVAEENYYKIFDVFFRVITQNPNFPRFFGIFVRKTFTIESYRQQDLLRSIGFMARYLPDPLKFAEDLEELYDALETVPIGGCLERLEAKVFVMRARTQARSVTLREADENLAMEGQFLEGKNVSAFEAWQVSRLRTLRQCFLEIGCSQKNPLVVSLGTVLGIVD